MKHYSGRRRDGLKPSKSRAEKPATAAGDGGTAQGRVAAADRGRVAADELAGGRQTVGREKEQSVVNSCKRQSTRAGALNSKRPASAFGNVRKAFKPSDRKGLYLYSEHAQSSDGFEKPSDSYLVDPASSHMLVSKIKPCKCKYELTYSETANGSLNQLWFI